MDLNLQGAYTALITPFKHDLSIDYDSLKSMMNFQIKSNIDGIVVCGTTGESPTLSQKEKLSIFVQSVEYSAKRTPIIAGTGSNNTADSIDLTLLAKEHGVDATLIVTPYYNKPTQEGLYHHYLAIAESCDIPIILYNVPGRTGVNMNAETQLRLAEECDNIIATKEASGDMEQIMQVLKYAPKDFTVLSGDDALTYSMMTAGAKGVVSVLSNYLPTEMAKFTKSILDGNFNAAKEWHYKLLELMHINFIETSPVPVKTVMSMLGYCEEVFRMPILPISDKAREYLITSLADNGVITLDD